MRAASSEFARAIATSHQIVTRVDVLFDRQVIVEGVAVLDGSITFDRTAARLASLDITLLDPVRIPTGPTDVLTPFGYELRVWRGVKYRDTASSETVFVTFDGDSLVFDGDPIVIGSVDFDVAEIMPLGTFPIQRSQVNAVDRVTQIQAFDRSQLVSDARFEDDYQVAQGTNYATAIEALISDGVDGLEYLFPSVSDTTPLLTFSAQEDRWEAAQRMARSIGHEILFDGLGRCVLRPEPTFDTEPVATVADAVNLLDATVALDREPAYNKVVVFSVNASTGAQYRGTATDDDPTSPTFYDGPFGRKPRFYYSEFVASNAQARRAARAILSSQLGVAKTVDLSLVPDPRLECSDVVRVTNTALGIDELHIIDRLSLSLGPEQAMFAGVRAQEGAATEDE